jgi:hypothetical protein
LPDGFSGLLQAPEYFRRLLIASRGTLMRFFTLIIFLAFKVHKVKREKKETKATKATPGEMR